TRVKAASEHVVRAQAALEQARLRDEASRQERRSELARKKSAVQDRLRQVEAAEGVARQLARRESDLADARRAVASRQAEHERAAAELDHATWSAELSSLLELDASAVRLQEASDDAQRRESAAAEALAQAEADLAAAESYRQHRGWLAEPALAA